MIQLTQTLSKRALSPPSRVFTNKDGSKILLVYSDLSLSGEDVATFYKRRWKVEEFHKNQMLAWQNLQPGEW